MTAGEDALREAARLESARVYSETLERFRERLSSPPTPAVDVDDIDAAIDRRLAAHTARSQRRRRSVA